MNKVHVAGKTTSKEFITSKLRKRNTAVKGSELLTVCLKVWENA